MKQNKKIISLAMILTVTAYMFTGCSGSGSKNEIPKEDTQEVSAKAADVQHSSTAGKEETVYVLSDGDGNTAKTIVSEWLKNPEGEKQLTDVSNLEDIVTVKGNAGYTQGNKGVLTWDTDGGDVYYQGISKEELPVEVSIEYTLDGKKISASELAGASGHLKMCFHYKNNTGKEETIDGKKCKIYQPFAMISGLILDNEKAVNVTVTNGKVINDGSHSILLGIALPGLKESLGLDQLEDTDGNSVDVDIPEDVTVEADVTDFSMTTAITAASNEALNELGLDDISSLDDLKGKMKELTDGIDEIQSGASGLRDGIASLADGAGELKNGALQLKDGVSRLNGGANELNEGAGKLKNGAAQLNSGALQLKDGIGQADSGAGELKSGTLKLKDGALRMKDGISQADSGAAQLNNGLLRLNGRTSELVNGVNQLYDGGAAIAAGLGQLTEQNQTLGDGANAVADGLGSLSNSLNSEEADQALKGLVSGSEKYGAGLNQASWGLNQIVQGYDYKSGDISQLMEALESYVSSENADPALKVQIETLIQAYQGLYNSTALAALGVAELNENYGTIGGGIQGMAGSMQKAASAAGQLAAGAASVRDGVSAYTAGVSQAASGFAQLYNGISQLQNQTPELVSGVGQLAAGASALAEGTNQLVSGASDLTGAADALAAGTSALAEGTNQLVSGASDLTGGTSALAAGASDLTEGTEELAAGTGSLAEGTSGLESGMDTLTDGAARLLSGSGELLDGIVKFKEEGIQKIAGMINNDLEGYLHRLQAVQKYAKEYKGFGGCEENVECSVKFIYKTDSIDK